MATAYEPRRLVRRASWGKRIISFATNVAAIKAFTS